MDEGVLIETRRALHGVGELLIAGPQYRALGTIRLRVVPGGFGGVKLPLAVSGVELVGERGRWPLRGTFGSLGTLAGVDVGAPDGLYHDHSGVAPDDEIVFDAEAAAVLSSVLERGDAGLRNFAPDAEPILWPEHFDVGIAVDDVNYGVSLGDAAYPRPYAYVGPHTLRPGEFWNAPFGAVRWMDELDSVAAVATFFKAGAAAAAAG
jgi:hypothetical protein